MCLIKSNILKVAKGAWDKHIFSWDSIRQFKQVAIIESTLALDKKKKLDKTLSIRRIS